MLNKKLIEDIRNHQVPYDESAWNAFEQELSMQNPKLGILKILGVLSMIFCLALVTYFIKGDWKNSKNAVSSNDNSQRVEVKSKQISKIEITNQESTSITEDSSIEKVKKHTQTKNFTIIGEAASRVLNENNNQNKHIESSNHNSEDQFIPAMNSLNSLTNPSSRYINGFSDIEINSIFLPLDTMKMVVSKNPPSSNQENFGLNSFYLGVGYAQINTNNGLYFGSGVQFGLSKLLSIELGFDYSCSNENNDLNLAPYNWSNQREFDINLQLAFNLYSSNKNQLELLIGRGYSYYYSDSFYLAVVGEEVSRYQKEHWGWNIIGGLNYKHFFNNKIGIGCRLGIISYDDSVIFGSINYVNRF